MGAKPILWLFTNGGSLKGFNLHLFSCHAFPVVQCLGNGVLSHYGFIKASFKTFTKVVNTSCIALVSSCLIKQDFKLHDIRINVAVLYFDFLEFGPGSFSLRCVAELAVECHSEIDPKIFIYYCMGS